MFQKRMAPSQQGNGTTGRKKDLIVSCDDTKHETTSPEQDHSIASARTNGWAECRDKKVSAPSRRRKMSLDIPFYRTSPVRPTGSYPPIENRNDSVPSRLRRRARRFVHDFRPTHLRSS